MNSEPDAIGSASAAAGGEERLFTQEEVNQVIAKRIAGMPTRRDLAALRDEVQTWRDRAQRNLGEISALERQLEDARDREANQ